MTECAPTTRQLCGFFRLDILNLQVIGLIDSAHCSHSLASTGKIRRIDCDKYIINNSFQIQLQRKISDFRYVFHLKLFETTKVKWNTAAD